MTMTVVQSYPSILGASLPFFVMVPNDLGTTLVILAIALLQSCADDSPLSGLCMLLLHPPHAITTASAFRRKLPQVQEHPDSLG